MPRELAAYLYSGITAVKSVGDPLDAILKVRTLVNSGERLGAELFACGPMFTAAGGHGTESSRTSGAVAQSGQGDRTDSADAEEARQQVQALKQRGVDGIKAILEAGQARAFQPMDVRFFEPWRRSARRSCRRDPHRRFRDVAMPSVALEQTLREKFRDCSLR